MASPSLAQRKVAAGAAALVGDFTDWRKKPPLAVTSGQPMTLTLPRAKATAFDFIPAATELSGAGMWRDPSGVSNDVRADNVIVEVEFGEVAGELVGHGIVRCLSLINNLEVNEQILYARMVNVEESTLIE